MQPATRWLPRWWAAAAAAIVLFSPIGEAQEARGPGRAVATLPDLRDWQTVEQPGVTVLSDTGRATTADVAARVRALQEVFAGVWPLDEPVRRPVVVVAVRSAATLRSWLPASVSTARHARPAGAFVRGLDRDYLAVALDSGRPSRFAVLDHEYGHLLVDRRCERLPVWLDEGLAELVATALHTREAADQVVALAGALRFERLLPLTELLQVDRHSPHYTDGRKAPRFYAHAWTFVHYLLVADGGARADRVAAFMASLRRGVPDREAATGAFGDLGTTERAWHRYVRSGAFVGLRPPLPRFGGERVHPRALSAAEGYLLVGDLAAHAGRTAEGIAMLEAAGRLGRDRLALERIALAHLAARDFAAAERLAARVLAQGHRRPIAHYVRAVAVMAQATALSPALVTQSEQDLRTAIALAPGLARAYAVLGGLLAVSRRQTEDGLALVRQAVALDPSDPAHRVALAQALLLDGQPDEARWLARHIVERAVSDEERAIGQRLLRLASEAAPKQVQRAEEQPPR